MKKLAILCAVALALAFGCANWANLTVEQKSALACDASIDMVKPECARLDDQATCLAAFDAAKVACHAAISKDATQVCPAIQAASVKCDAIEKDLDRSTCQRLFVAANAACVIATAKPAAE
jgi:hypothetical protein